MPVACGARCEVGHGLTRVLPFGSPSGRRDQMTLCIGRREFITLLGGAAAAWPLAARAEQPRKIYRVGLLVTGVPMGATDKRRQTFLSVLAAHGFVDGQNLVFVQRSDDAHPERLDDLA